MDTAWTGHLVQGGVEGDDPGMRASLNVMLSGASNSRLIGSFIPLDWF